MKKFRVVGDSNANPFFSSSLIINGLNEAAKKAGLYDENGATIVYSTTCDNYGHKNIDAFICLYEMAFPLPILNNAAGRPIIGSSYHNMCFAVDGGYPRQLCGYVNLGVDTNVFSPIKREGNLGKFRFLSFAESNTRCGLDALINAFGKAFGGNKDVELYIKDRHATDIFQEYVKSKATEFNVNIIHDIENTQDFEQIKKIYAESDVHVFVNRSSTWALTCIESMAMGLPLIAMPYSGPAEYLRDGFNGLAVDFELEEIKDYRIFEMQSMGMRNHLFPRHMHRGVPYWAEPKEESLIACLKNATNSVVLKSLSKNAILTSRYFTWEKAAYNLSWILNNFDIQRSDTNLNFNRYA